MQSLWILVGTFLTVLTYVFVKLTPEALGVADIFFVRSVFLALVLYVWREQAALRFVRGCRGSICFAPERAFRRFCSTS